MEPQKQTNRVKIFTASAAGVCFGVERALNLSEKSLKDQSQPISSLGPIIHNPQTVEGFKARGMKVADTLDEISHGKVVFRSHGVTIEQENAAKKKGLEIVDATCPLVKVPQKFASKLSRDGYYVVIVGDRNHPEIIGVKSYVENQRVSVIQDESEVSSLPDVDKVGIISQTTIKRSVLDKVVAACKLRFAEVKFHNTICSATKDRQEAAFELAKIVECMVVIGGRNSSNTRKLLEISESLVSKSYQVETSLEIQKRWFDGVASVGVTAGASTPHEMILEIKNRIADLTGGETCDLPL